MKTLVLLRHAKSSWKDPNLHDLHRPLNKRGKSDLPIMAERLSQEIRAPSILVCSPAKRARKTIRVIAKYLNIDKKNVHINEKLYMATPTAVLDVVHDMSDMLNYAVLCGHNPGLTDLINQLIPHQIENLPTCAAVFLQSTSDNWADFEKGQISSEKYLFPKDLHKQNIHQ